MVTVPTPTQAFMKDGCVTTLYLRMYTDGQGQMDGQGGQMDGQKLPQVITVQHVKG